MEETSHVKTTLIDLIQIAPKADLKMLLGMTLCGLANKVKLRAHGQASVILPRTKYHLIN